MYCKKKYNRLLFFKKKIIFFIIRDLNEKSEKNPRPEEEKIIKNIRNLFMLRRRTRLHCN